MRYVILIALALTCQIGCVTGPPRYPGQGYVDWNAIQRGAEQLNRPTSWVPTNDNGTGKNCHVVAQYSPGSMYPNYVTVCE